MVSMEKEDVADYVKKLQEKAELFFKRAGQDPLEVYRIEKFEPVMQDTEHQGKFYTGDSYVVCCKNKKDYDIHYWHGKESTADEQGSSAALTVQLSEHLALPSKHHLEEQCYESDLFMSHFKKGVQYLDGGCDSGFKHVTPKEYPTRLLKVKGTRYPRIHEVPVKADELNEGDCFILDMGMNLYYFQGEEANKYEKLKGLEIAVAIKNDERHSKPKLWYPRDMGGKCEEDFWAALGGKPAKINPPEPDDAPKGTEEEMAKYSFFKVSNDTGKMECTEITDRPLDKQKHLDTNETYILELYDMVYVWIGDKANKDEKQQAMATAKQFIKDHNKIKGCRVTRLNENIEDSLFKSYFENFYPALNLDGGDKTTHANQDISAMANTQKKAAEMLFDKLGPNYTRTIYFVNHNDWTYEQVTPEEEGYFWAESVYLIDIKSESHQYLIKWMGRRVEGDDYAKFNELVTKHQGGVLTDFTTLMPLRKGAEDEAFLQFFPKGFFILDEERVPFADYQNKVKEHGAMFRIQAPHGAKSRAIEQNGLECKYLNSHDSYVAYTADCQKCYVWHGTGAAPAEEDGCNTLVANFFKQPGSTQTFKEGSEPEEFWAALGGKSEYSQVKEGNNAHPDFEPRLFACSNSSGFFFCKEVVNFTQEDLVNSDVMMLDCWNTIYLWIGTESNKFERNGAKKAAQKYLDGITDGRSKEHTHIDEINAGHEPIQFTAQFMQWEPELAQEWLEADPVAKLKAKEAAQHAAEEEAKNKDPFEGFLDPNTNKFKYEDLKGKFPEGVKPDAKPDYLTDEEFEAVFKMKREAYKQLKGWKQTDLRKKFELF